MGILCSANLGDVALAKKETDSDHLHSAQTHGQKPCERTLNPLLLFLRLSIL